MLLLCVVLKGLKAILYFVVTDGSNDWDNPRNNRTRVVIGNETVYVGIFWGYQYAIMKEDLSRREFIKGGDIIFLFSMQGK